ncbi:hypothetical protein WA026_019465 [Henosepilachna vigintioctopunctata]|uniref:Uncharacterized protein n=1 Tax=Henosepilachna vigintioctopunctata TaxID=420089 RepID=A0AAW1UA54_9CUCU
MQELLIVFNESCARRMKNVTILNGAIVTCCEDAIMHKTAINENFSELSVENSYLKKLLKGVEEKNEILIENNNLLKEKLKSLDLNANKKLLSEVISGKSKQETYQIQNVNKHKKESQTARRVSDAQYLIALQLHQDCQFLQTDRRSKY